MEETASKIQEITDKLQIPWILKGSYRKANRSRLDSFTGIGDEKALKPLRIFTFPKKQKWQANMLMYCKFLRFCVAKRIYSLRQRKRASM